MRGTSKTRRIAQHWIYQERKVSKPWAVSVFVELQSDWYAPRIQATIFHEDMYKGHDDSIFNVRIYSPSDFASTIVSKLNVHGIVADDDDIDQLWRAWLDIILNL